MSTFDEFHYEMIRKLFLKHFVLGMWTLSVQCENVNNY